MAGSFNRQAGAGDPWVPKDDVVSGALGGAGTGAGIGTAIFPGIGTAIGAVGGALVGALPSLLGNEADKANRKRMQELERLRELDALGLTPAEKEQMYNAYLAQSQVQVDKMTADRNRQLSSAVSMGAGQGIDAAAQREEAAATARSNAAMVVEQEHLKRKRQMEEEYFARTAAAGQQTKDRQAAVAGIAKTGIDAFTEQKAQSDTISGPGVKAPDISAFASEYGISEDQASSALGAISDNPELLEYINLLGGR